MRLAGSPRIKIPGACSAVITRTRQARVQGQCLAWRFCLCEKRERKRMLTGPTRASDVTRKESRGRSEKPNALKDWRGWIGSRGKYSDGVVSLLRLERNWKHSPTISAERSLMISRSPCPSPRPLISDHDVCLLYHHHTFQAA